MSCTRWSTVTKFMSSGGAMEGGGSSMEGGGSAMEGGGSAIEGGGNTMDIGWAAEQSITGLHLSHSDSLTLYSFHITKHKQQNTRAEQRHSDSANEYTLE